MSPIDAAIIRRKLQRIAASLDGLRPIARLSLEEYRARFYERKATERLLQEAIEAALDINAHLIAESGSEVPEEYYGGFLKVGRPCVRGGAPAALPSLHPGGRVPSHEGRPVSPTA